MFRPLASSILVWLALEMVVCRGTLAQTPLPFDELGAGPRATALGQAFTALADDTSAAYYNPAGLVQIRSPLHLTIGYAYAKPRIRVTFETPPVQNPALGRVASNQVEDFSTKGLYVGYACTFADVSAFRHSPVAGRFSVGLALLTNLPQITQFDNPQRPQDPYVFKYNERWSLVSFALSAAFRCTPWLSVGAGIVPRIDSLQESRGSWLDIIGAADPKDASRGMRMNLSATTRLGVVPIGGVLAAIPWGGGLKGRVSIGVSYRGKVYGYYGTGLTGVDVLVSRPGRDPVIIYSDPGTRTVDYIGFTPEQVTFGVALKDVHGLTLTSDLTWKRYSAFHFFWDLPPYDIVDGVRVENPFKDVWVPRIGVLYSFSPCFEGTYTRKITEISLLAGYYREPSPVPSMDGPMNILDADQNVVSAGIGIVYDAEWTGRLRCEAYVQAHLLEENYIKNDRDPLFSPITVGGYVIAGGIALSVAY